MSDGLLANGLGPITLKSTCPLGPTASTGARTAFSHFENCGYRVFRRPFDKAAIRIYTVQDGILKWFG